MTVRAMLRIALKMAARNARLADRAYWAARKSAEETVGVAYSRYLTAQSQHMAAIDRLARENDEASQ